jgi:hypothetical protein
VKKEDERIKVGFGNDFLGFQVEGIMSSIVVCVFVVAFLVSIVACEVNNYYTSLKSKEIQLQIEREKTKQLVVKAAINGKEKENRSEQANKTKR